MLRMTGDLPKSRNGDVYEVDLYYSSIYTEGRTIHVFGNCGLNIHVSSMQNRVVPKKRKPTFGGHFEIFPGGN